MRNEFFFRKVLYFIRMVCFAPRPISVFDPALVLLWILLLIIFGITIF